MAGTWLLQCPRLWVRGRESKVMCLSMRRTHGHERVLIEPHHLLRHTALITLQAQCLKGSATDRMERVMTSLSIINLNLWYGALGYRTVRSTLELAELS